VDSLRGQDQPKDEILKKRSRTPMPVESKGALRDRRKKEGHANEDQKKEEPERN